MIHTPVWHTYLNTLKSNTCFIVCSSYISIFNHQWPTNSIWSISERSVYCVSLKPQRKRRVIYEWFKCLESALSTESVTCYCQDDDACLSSWIWQTYRGTGKSWKGLDTVRVAFSCGCTTDLNFTTRFNDRCVLWYYQLCPYYGGVIFLFNIWLIMGRQKLENSYPYCGL
jgi:hypothetical protein